MTEEFITLVIIIAVLSFFSAPVSLILSIIAMTKVNRLLREYESSQKPDKDVLPKSEPIRTKVEPAPQLPALKPESPKPEQKSEPVEPQIDLNRLTPLHIDKELRDKSALELQIGTRWILIAGVITVIVGVCFFLKYAYDNFSLGPIGKITAAALSGLAALIIGEVSRRRGYDLVAKGVTALGFAILYATVFSAYMLFALIDSPTAFGFSILLTAAAMLYAVKLDEVLIAILSLVGAFLTPVLVSTGENLPVPLFSYLLILGLGTMSCAYFRKWKSINLISFVGTFILYTGWFETFFRGSLHSGGVPEQMPIAIGCLCVFFAVYLIAPLLYGLVHKTKAMKQDVVLVVIDALVSFYYLWTVLYQDYRVWLAVSSVLLSGIFLTLLIIVSKRCREDDDLKLVLLAIGLFFITIALPLYFRMRFLVMAWTFEAVALLIISIRYKSELMRIASFIVLALSIGQLIKTLPLHDSSFTLFLNPDFGLFVFVAAAAYICHLICRCSRILDERTKHIAPPLLYILSVVLLLSAALMEWWCHCRYNIGGNIVGDILFMRGVIVSFVLAWLILSIKPPSPQGILPPTAALIVAGVSSVFIAVGFWDIYHAPFIIFLNIDFLFAVIFTAGLFADSFFIFKRKKEDKNMKDLSMTLAFMGIIVLWILLNAQIYSYWYWQGRADLTLTSWRFLSHMYISVLWAVYGAVLMIVGFWKNIKVLRYMALVQFAILLVKVFIFDMGTVKSVYRITAFLATGVTLVGISYIYQYVRKKGFFGGLSTEATMKESSDDRS